MVNTDKPMKYDANRIIGTFGLERGTECEILSHLMSVNGVLEPKYVDFLEEHRQSLIKFGDYWNEEELKMNFLAHIFYVAQLHEPKKINVFYERTIKAELNGKKESVKCDCIVAKPFGIYDPQVPYFFLQEFKKQKQNEDAEGQMLLAMLIAQKENNNDKPIYGCYLQGKNWVFTTLHQSNYCVSRQFDTSQKADLEQVILILRKLKSIILTDLI